MKRSIFLRLFIGCVRGGGVQAQLNHRSVETDGNYTLTRFSESTTSHTGVILEQLLDSRDRLGNGVHNDYQGSKEGQRKGQCKTGSQK